MTAVRFVESSKYGAWLFGYLLVSVTLGAALFGLGWTLAWPAVLDALPGGPVVDRAEVAAGVALAVLGVYVAGSGLLATINKFIADSVSQGVDAADLAVEVRTDAASTETKASSEPPGGSDETDPAATGEAIDDTGVDAESEPLKQRTTEVVEPSGEPTAEPGSLEAAQGDVPRELSPEEIVFVTTETDSESEGSSSQTEPPAEQTDDE
jgi:hypothetical protein